MPNRSIWIAAMLGALAIAGLASQDVLAQNEIFLPNLVYRTGPFAPSGIPVANGLRDYYAMINARDGGINGVKIVWEECETQYNTKLGVECYEKLKNKGPTGAAFFNPYSTGITYELITKSWVDKIPIFSMGYGQTAAADGRVFEYVFNFPDTYWSQASALVRYVGMEEGGLDKLKGKKIALIYHNSAYGKEPISTLRALSAKFGYEFVEMPVDSPGQEQKATWLRVRQTNPDWIFMWGWGVMNSTAIKEAASIGYPMDHFIGVWWSGSEADVIPAGDGAIKYKSGTFHAPGAGFGVHKEILKWIYNGDMAKAKENTFGEVLYNRGVVNAMYGVEAIRTAMTQYGNKPLKGEQVRWGFEHLNLTAQRLKEIGMEGMLRPLAVSCADHEVGEPVRIQQWDGRQWNFVSDWIAPMRDIVRPMQEQAAMAYAKENNITPRSCN